MDAKAIADVMAEIGPHDPDIVAVVERREGGWVVRYEDADVDVEFDTLSDRIVLSIEVAPVAHEGQAALMKAMLNFNLLWRETGGVRMALAPEGTVIQIADLSGDAGIGTLRSAFSNLRAKTGIWRKIISSGAGEESTDSLSPPGIRV